MGSTAQSTWGKGGNGAGNGGKNGSKGQGGKGQGGGPGRKGQGGMAQGGGEKATTYPGWKIPRGTRIDCGNKDCDKTGEWADAAHWACPKCNTSYDWQQLWDSLAEPGGTASGNSESGEDDAANTKVAEASQDTKIPPKIGSPEATALAKTATNVAYTAWQKAKSKLERESIDFTNMGQKLEKLVDAVDEQAARMSTKRQVVADAHNDNAAAMSIYSKRVADQEAAMQTQLDAVAGQLFATTDRMAVARRAARTEEDSKNAERVKHQAAVEKAQKAKQDREAKAKAAQAAAAKAEEEADALDSEVAELDAELQTSKEALQHMEAGSSAEGAQAVPVKAGGDTVVTPPAVIVQATANDASSPMDGDDDLDEDDLDEDEPTPVAPCNMDAEQWIKEVADWAFYAEADGEPNPDLVGWVVSWEDDPKTKQQVHELLVAARDKYLEARKGAASDDAVVKQVAGTGDLQSAQEMHTACSVYNATKFQDIYTQLVAHLQSGMQQHWEQRKKDLDTGARKAPKAWKFVAVHPTKAGGIRSGAKNGVRKGDKKGARATSGMAEAAKGAKEKAKAAMDKDGLTAVTGGTATAAAEEVS